MTTQALDQRQRVLDPDERLSEILFGLIMVLTFTSSMSAATAGRDEVRTTLLEAFGCNLAWGIVDGVMYLTAIVMERGRMLTIGRGVRAADPARGRNLIAESLPGRLGELFDEAALEGARKRVLAVPEPSRYPRLYGRDFLGALAVCTIVFLSTCPVALPFLFFSPAQTALRISNAVAVVMLYGVGHAYGRHSGLGPVRVGLAMVAVGIFLIGVTIALGG